MAAPGIIIDTNVLASGLRSRRGASFGLLSKLGNAEFTVVVTVPLVIEYEKTLRDPRVAVPFSADEVGRYRDYLCSVAEPRRVHFLWRPVLADQKDDMVLEAAVNGECRFIVTFNLAHFGGSERFGGAALSPRDLLARLGDTR